MNGAKIANPDLDDFFSVWLAGFTVGGKLYGLSECATIIKSVSLGGDVGWRAG